LRAGHYGVTCIDGEGAVGPVTVVLTVIPRKELAGVVTIIKEFDPDCFYSVDDVQSAEAGVFPHRRPTYRFAKRFLPAARFVVARSDESVPSGPQFPPSRSSLS
ncbi:MAG TPA: DUF2179 domain-containing protein, partial [Gemmataceae bacterium]|nr:DUF2179 domain-containing protein [Gemmataceae bacterium]